MSTRRSQWKKYLQFCADTGLPGVPAETLTVARFLTFLARSCKFSTINNYLTAVIVLHKYHGFTPDFRETFYMKLVLKGLRRILGEETSKAAPLLPLQLQCYKILDKTDSWWVTCWSAIILCFRSLLRKSNVLPINPHDKAHLVLRKDVSFFSWGVLLRAHSSKTAKSRKEAGSTNLRDARISPVCSHLLKKTL